MKAVRDRTSDPRYFDGGELHAALLTAKTRSIAYWSDECDRDLDRVPALSVDVLDLFPGAGGCCIEYSAVLTDVSSRLFRVEGVNLLRMRDGWISYLRSFEDAPRPIPVGRSAPHGHEEAEAQAEGSGYERQ